MTIRIDAHQHFWRIEAPWHEWPGADLPAICRDFLPADLAPALQGCGIDGTVLVQSQPSDADTDWMLALAERTPSILGVVGWVDFRAADAAARIGALAAHPKLKGLRPMLQNLPPDWILHPDAASAIEAMVAHGLVFDALIRPAHLHAIATLADRYPALSIVVDHGAKPDLAAGALAGWAEGLADIAERQNVVCKLSGLVTEAGEGWSEADLKPFVRHILDVFGPERVLWGSDWPVLLLRADYERWHKAARALVHERHANAVFGENAAATYRLTSEQSGGNTSKAAQS